MHLRFGADVDSSGWLINKENFWFQSQISGQHHLLLVSARQGANDYIFVGHTDPEALLKLADQSGFSVSINEKSKSAEPLQAWQSQVPSHTLGQKKCMLFAVFGNQRHSQLDGRSRRIDLYWNPLQVNFSGFERFGAINCPNQVSSAGTNKSG